LFQEIHDLFKVKLSRKHLTFSIHLDDLLPTYLLLDEMRLRQVLTNLVGNAFKFTENGQIRLSAKILNRPSTDTVDLMIRVRDTGIGISKDQQALIFESFEQGHKDITRKYGGTGLGLAISRQLVELMNGRIQVDSRPGFGSCFEIVLPGVIISRTGKQTQKAFDTVSLKMDRSAPEPVLSESLIQQAMDRHPDLEHQMFATIFPLLPGTQDGVKMSDAQTIADHFITLGREFDLTAFTQFGQNLSDDVQAFDVENIAPSLARIAVLFQQIQEK
jgi:anti-sigma regulatory factor (Ser/Thr protein kinase)